MSRDEPFDQLEHATSQRLARLAARPVDTMHLQRRLDKVLAAEAGSATSNGSTAWQRWWRPISSAAAAILIGLTLGWFALESGTSPAMAAPTELAKIHFEVANGLAPHLEVSSVAEANQLLADQINGVVAVPQLPGTMKSCCLHAHAGTMLTCALIEQDGRLITVAMADGAKLHSPKGQTLTRGGRTFFAHTTNGINMVMAHEGDRWLCVMGELDFDELADVAAQIKFTYADTADSQ